MIDARIDVSEIAALARLAGALLHPSTSPEAICADQRDAVAEAVCALPPGAGVEEVSAAAVLPVSVVRRRLAELAGGSPEPFKAAPPAQARADRIAAHLRETGPATAYEIADALGLPLWQVQRTLCPGMGGRSLGPFVRRGWRKECAGRGGPRVLWGVDDKSETPPGRSRP